MLRDEIFLCSPCGDAITRDMDMFSLFSASDLILACAVALMAGTIKGVVGFAMPTVFIASLAGFLSPEIALAGLILPTLVSNGMQAFRQGVGAAVDSVKAFKTFKIYGAVAMICSAQLVRFLPTDIFFFIIGAPVTLFAIMQLFGVQFKITKQQRPLVERISGVVAGGIGGLSGIWGPPTVALLTALNTEKTEQMRVQGVIYGLGAGLLAVSHITSGVLNAQTLPFSVLLIGPAVVGMWLGGLVQDRFDQVTFKRITLLVLLIGGINLIRRGLLG